MRSDLPPPRPPGDSGVRLTDPASHGHGVDVTCEAILLPATPAGLDPSAATPRSTALGESGVHSREAAFRAMYEAHVDFVWRNLRRLGVGLTEADDRAQEVFVIAHRRFDQFEDRGHGPRAWLFQIVLRIASDARRHRRRHPEDPDGGVAESRESIEPEQTIELARREAVNRLDQALSMIDVARRAVLVLHEIEEMTAPEIAQILGIPLNTVYSRLRVARTELEEALARGPIGQRENVSSRVVARSDGEAPSERRPRVGALEIGEAGPRLGSDAAGARVTPGERR
jgi:RNA polymerase sigma-70 factor (ECF subfamily)